MPLTHTMRRTGSTLTIGLSGDFTFSENNAFRQIIDEAVAARPSSVIIDLSGLRGVDSAGLSMFVMMRDRLGPIGASIALHHPPPLVERILSVVDFGKLFTIVR